MSEPSPDQPKAVVTVIADSGFVLPVYILVLSLKFTQPKQRIHILGISLSDKEKSFFTQFEQVHVYDASIPRNNKPGAMRIIADILKGEALLTASECDEPWVALLDGDCIAVGDISSYLAPGDPALYVRTRSPEEDNRILQYYRRPGDPRNGIPPSFLDRWKKDVGQRETPARQTTALSGNIVLHRRFLGFAEVWQEFMMRVLDPNCPEQTDPAYYMPAEFALSAWLAFADDPPPVREAVLNSHPEAYLAHLGPAPKYWHFWTPKNLKYFDLIIRLLEEAEKKRYEIPALPFALKKRNKLIITGLAAAYGLFFSSRRQVRRLYKRIAGNSPEKQARRYGR